MIDPRFFYPVLIDNSKKRYKLVGCLEISFFLMGKKILIIEDNHDVRDNLAEILEFARYEVIQAENGKIGVAKAISENPDLIICDIMMPEKDGYEVLSNLSKMESTASIPFIFLTAKAEKSDLRRGMNMGADDYITKPFEESDVLTAIESRIRKKELLKKTYSQDLKGLDDFLNDVGGREKLLKLTENRKHRTYKKKEFIYHEGDQPSYLYYINKGSVKIYKISENGKEFILEILREGEFFGYTSLLENNVYSDFAETMEATELTLIPKDDFVELINQNRDVAARFIRLLTAEVKDKENQILNLAYNSVKRRLADTLLNLSQQFDENTFFTVSREDLASMVGTATETVIRSISEFKDMGILEVQGRQIKIKDSEKLATIPL